MSEPTPAAPPGNPTLAEQIERLISFARHTPLCRMVTEPWGDPGQFCSCGLDKTLALARAAARPAPAGDDPHDTRPVVGQCCNVASRAAYGPCPYCGRGKPGFAAPSPALAAPPAGAEPDGWVSVADAAPRKWHKYLVSDERDRVLVAESQGNGWWLTVPGNYDVKVTHYRELPEPAAFSSAFPAAPSPSASPAPPAAADGGLPTAFYRDLASDEDAAEGRGATAGEDGNG